MTSNLKTTTIALVLLTVFSCWNPSFGQEKRSPKRVALVIGNSEYKTAAKLTNPKNDAQSISKALKSVGFTVTTQFDRSKFQIESDIDAVTEGLAQGDAVFVFFAGHGIELKNSNYLVPTDAAVTREFHVKQRCVDADYVLAAMEDSGASLRVMVLDACRNNPFRSFTRNAGSGLAAMQAPEGTIIAYSTAPGTVALDGTGDNSPFTKHLVKTLQSHPAEGLEINSVFTTVARAVKKETGQRAYLTNDASMERYLLKPAVLTKETKVLLAKDLLRIKKLNSIAADDGLSAIEFREAKRLIERPASQLNPLERNRRDVYVSLADGEISPVKFAKAMRLLVAELSSYKFESLPVTREHADLGFAKAQFQLGMQLLEGEGVEMNVKEGVAWVRKSAEQNHDAAQVELGESYRDGRGVDKDYKKAGHWFRKAAAQNNASAESALGYMYLLGHGVSKDYAESLRWYRMAAGQGNSLAEHQLGFMYALGFGVDKDEAEALRWYRKAAEKGFAGSADALGRIYENGFGVSKDDEEALRWYRRAAVLGDDDAQCRLGRMYLEGDGVSKDNAEALRWYRKAAAQGNKEAKQASNQNAREKITNDELKANNSPYSANLNSKKHRHVPQDRAQANVVLISNHSSTHEGGYQRKLIRKDIPNE